MKKDKNTKKSSSVIPIVILAAVILSFLTENTGKIGRFLNSGVSADAILVILIVIVVIAGVIAVIASAKKKANEVPAAVRAREHELKERADSEAAVRCTCAKGRQRYLDQADMFLKNGLIDKAEWKIMRERYQKMEIPENM